MLIENLKDGKYKVTITPKGLDKELVFEEHKDKFIYDNQKTIGFRKDKKLNKFVGLRDGYSKQLEFSLVSVIIDGVNKIPKNRSNFNSVSLEEQWIVHDINKLKFFNEVDDTNYRNMVEINEPLSSLEIIYEIHTKGIKVVNRKTINRYVENADNQFIFGDDGNEQTIFILDNPVVIDNDGNEFNIVNHSLYTEDGKLLYKKKIGRLTEKYNFPLYVDANVMYNNIGLRSNGVGVISSTGDVWDDVKSGTGSSILFIEHNSSIGTFTKSVGTYFSGGTYKIYRSYLNYDTSIFSGYTDSLSSVKLIFNAFGTTNQGIWVMKGLYTGGFLSNSMWDDFDILYTGLTYTNINLVEVTEFTLPLTSLNLTGITSFVLLSEDDYNNYEPTSDYNSFTGIDFNGTTLEVIYEPLKVYGQTELNVIKGEYFFLTGYTNYGSSSDIQWFRDSGYTQLISTGSTLLGYSMEYEYPNNVIYAVVPIITYPYYSLPLMVIINVIKLRYDILPEKNIDYDEIDIDSIYFKYHKCLSGVCYTYVRDINNIYEGFPLVSDSWENASYNLYNEFDVIDEFFGNSHEVEVAYNSNLDLTKKYKNLDNVPLHDGSRVLLMSQTDVTELGVYVVQSDFSLKRIDELNTYDNMFRYKVHVGAGSYFDQEIHIWPILPPPLPPYIQVFPNPAELEYLSGVTIMVTIESDTSWTLYNPIPWVTVTSSSGTGNKTITIITTMENTTSINREGTIEFTGFGGAKTILTVQQKINNDEILRVTTDGIYRKTTSGNIRTLNIA